jgi:hypothetical protein
VPDFRSAAAVFLEQSIRVFDADPNPPAGLSLIPWAQENVTLPRDTDAK